MSKEVEKLYRTAFTPRVRVHCPTGAKTEMRHEPEVDKWGRRILTRTREVPIYDIIQSHKEQCDFEKIIRRAREGDINALNVVEGHYIDITDAPHDLLESQNHIIKCKLQFEKLPADVKRKFDFDPQIYIAEMVENPESFAEKTGLKVKWEKEAEAEKARLEMEQLTQDAIKNLAQGTAFNNTEVKEGAKNE